MKGSPAMRSFYVPHARVYAPSDSTLITKQSPKDECDINKILTQYKKTGIITHISNNQSYFADLPDSLDYQESLQILESAETSFSALPARVRDEFSNDPGLFLAAFGDPTKAERLRELGLLKPLEAAGRSPQSPSSSSAPSSDVSVSETDTNKKDK